MKIRHLRCNHLENPVGYDLRRISLSWQYCFDKTDSAKTDAGKPGIVGAGIAVSDTDETEIEKTRIEIAQDPRMEHKIYDSGWDVLDPLDCEAPIGCAPRTRYYWRVSAVTKDGQVCASDLAFFETAKIEEAWQAKWICAPFEEHPVFAARFQACRGEQARAYICGLGLYELYCNGRKVGEEVLLPGYHSYDLRIFYQTLVLDDYIRDGENELQILLAPGWYMGRFGFGGGSVCTYGSQMTLLCELHVGDTVYGSDGQWLCRKSPVLESSMYDGEVWDASLEKGEDWTTAILLDAETAENMAKKLTARTNPPVRIVERVVPKEIIKTLSGDLVLDFGQNLAGWFCFTCEEPAGVRIEVDCAEFMQDGEFYRDNLRTAKARYEYISDGSRRVVCPHFTCYGYRYLRVRGISDLEKAEVQALVLSSVGERTGWLTTGRADVNRLIENTRWGQIGNFIDIPTDCPQRDERMGWTGDAQIFCGTACYFYDTDAFYAKFMQDLALEQKLLGGSVPFIVPNPKVNLMPGARSSSGSCAWGDAATIIPWTLYQVYGDRSLLREQYPVMRDWISYIQTQESDEHLWLSGFHFADWLALDNPAPGPMGKTDPHYCASAYYYYSTVLTQKAAEALDYKEDSAALKKLAEEIKESFLNYYYDQEGNCSQDTQTGYVLALMFGLYRPQWKDSLLQNLHKKLADNGMHLDTGFIGTAYLCRVLAENGLSDDALTVFLQEDMPGWLYQVRMGATTIWERWNSILEDGRMNPEGMNSLNHYAYGAVCEYLYRDLAGLSPLEPGFRKVRFAPHPDRRIGKISGCFQSVMGEFRFGWEIKGNECVYSLQIPYGCSAIVELPGEEARMVYGGVHSVTLFCR